MEVARCEAILQASHTAEDDTPLQVPFFPHSFEEVNKLCTICFTIEVSLFLSILHII